MRNRSSAKWLLPSLLGMIAGTGAFAGCLDAHTVETDTQQTELQRQTELSDVDTSDKASGTSASLVAEPAPFVAIGHGSVLLPDGKVVPPTAELARKVQAHYLSRLEQAADGATKQELQTRRAAIATQRVAAGSQAEINANAGLIAFLTDAVKPATLHSSRTPMASSRTR
jgi:hypothetical protein